MLFILQYQKHGDGKHQATLQADVGFKLLLPQMHPTMLSAIVFGAN
jgi:hypothetical protein